MKNAGLVSISFRKLTIEEIFKLCHENGLENIEWGSDVHCKPSDSEAIDKIVSLSEKYGIEDRRDESELANVWQTRVDTYYKRKNSGK